jgi:hypothetical protein
MKSQIISALSRLAIFGFMALVGVGCVTQSKDTSPPSTPPDTPLIWTDTPTSVTLDAGQSSLFHFNYPNTGGDPSAQFGSVVGTFDAYLCTVSQCGPSYPSNSAVPKVTCTVACQIWQVSPLTPMIYWVEVDSAAGASFTIQAMGT